ncbi:MAG: diguanylate cyclase [Magnetococcales bacterium]|nr:diguanylate cyclase [Magnetococcales bacterium]
MSLAAITVSTVGMDGNLVVLAIVVVFLGSFLTMELAVPPANDPIGRNNKNKWVAGTLVLGLGWWTGDQVSLALLFREALPEIDAFHFVRFWDILVPMATSLAAASLAMRSILFDRVTLRQLFTSSLLLTVGLVAILLATLLVRPLTGQWHWQAATGSSAIAGILLANGIALGLVFRPPPRFQIFHTSRLVLAATLLTASWILGSFVIFKAIFALDPLRYPQLPQESHHEWVAGLTIAIFVLTILVHSWHLFQERIQLEKKLNDLHLAQEIAHMGTWEWDLATNEVHWSSRLAKIYGVESVSNHGKASFFTHIIHAADRVDVLQCRREARSNPKAQWSIRYRINRPDGKILHLREHGRTLADAHHQPVRLLATVADITHIHDMEKREERVIQSQIALSALLETGLESLTLEKQLQVALHIIMTVPWLSVQYQGSIFLVEPKGSELIMAAQVGLSDSQLQACNKIQPGYCLCGRAFQFREIIFASQIDARHDIVYPSLKPHGHYCVPIMSRDRVLGVLNLYVPHGYKKNSEEDAFLTTISSSLAGLIDLRRTQARLLQEQEFSSTILRTAPSLVVVLHPDGSVILFNRACQMLTGYDESEVIGRKIWEFLLPEDEVTAFKDKLHSILQSQLAAEHEGHWLTKAGDRRLIAWSSSAIAITAEAGLHFVATGVDVSEKRLAEQRLQFLASHDSLTGLPNRVQFMEHLLIGMAQARRTGRYLAVMFLDLDRFKPVNDTLGHEVGDQLLIAVANRIRQSVREMDVVSRIGGDEFTVLMTGFSDVDRVDVIAGKIITNLDRVFEIGGHRIHIGTSIGISLFPLHGDDPQELLKKADQAMYFVKHRERNHFKIWDAALDRVKN